MTTFLDDGVLRKTCMILFPAEYRSKANVIRFRSRLPLEICQHIHQYRNLDDLQLSMKKVKEILGFSNGMTQKKRWKNRILDSLLFGSTAYVGLDSVKESFTDDRHLLMMSLHMSLLPRGSTMLFPITEITTFEMARELVTYAWQAYTGFPSEFRDNRDLALIALHQHVKTYDYMPYWFQLDREILRFVLPRKDGVFWNLNEELRSDEEMIRLALTRNWMNYPYLTDLLQREEWVVELMPKNRTTFNMLHPVHHRDTKTILTFMNECIEVYFFLDPDLRQHSAIQRLYRESRYMNSKG